MADRGSYRKQYENRVAELGPDSQRSLDQEELAPDEKDVRDAREVIEDLIAGKLEEDSPGVLRARQTLLRYEEHLAHIRALRLMVCSHALDAADAVGLMEHLGIAPGQPLPRLRISFTPMTVTSPRNITATPS